MRKLNYRFHNPNSEEATADAIIKVLILSNRAKVDRAIKGSVKSSAKRESQLNVTT
jgi:hypothetical protein